MVPVGFTKNLPANRVMRAWVNGEELAVWRSASGKLSAWDNRCPHRGMRLSFGFVRGEALACIYHGWHYGKNGVCKLIPAHPDLEPPETIRTKVHAIGEKHGVIWVSIEGEVAPPEFDTGFSPVRTININGSLEILRDHLRHANIVLSDGTPLKIDEEASTLDVIEFVVEGAPRRVLALLQSTGDHAVNLHLMSSQNWDTDGRLLLSRWCDRLQHDVEALIDGEVG